MINRDDILYWGGLYEQEETPFVLSRVPLRVASIISRTCGLNQFLRGAPCLLL